MTNPNEKPQWLQDLTTVGEGVLKSEVSGRPYTLLSEKGKSKLYLNLSCEIVPVKVGGNVMPYAALLVRFRGNGSGLPIPSREKDENDATLLKKYCIEFALLPAHPAYVRQALDESALLDKAYTWISARLESKGWKMLIPLEGFKAMGLAEFSEAPDCPTHPDPLVFPEW